MQRGQGGVFALLLDGDGGRRGGDLKRRACAQAACRCGDGRRASRAGLDRDGAAGGLRDVRAAEGHARRDCRRHIAAVSGLDSHGELRAGQRVAAEGIQIQLRGRARVLLLADKEDEVRAFAQLSVRRHIRRRARGVAGIGDACGGRAAAVEIQGRPAAERKHPLGQLRKRQTVGIARLVAGIQNERAVVCHADGRAGGHFLRGIECKVRADLPVFNQHITAACGGGHILPARGAGDLKRHLLAHDHALERGERAFIGGVVRNGKQEAVLRDGAGLRILHHADDLDGQRLPQAQLRRTGADRADDHMIALNGILGAGVVVLRVQEHAVLLCHGLVIVEHQRRIRAVVQRDGDGRVADERGAIGQKAHRVGRAAGAQDAVRDDDAVGNAGRPVKERTVDPRDHAVALLLKRLDGLVHGAGAVERRAEGDDGPHLRLFFIGKDILMQIRLLAGIGGNGLRAVCIDGPVRNVQRAAPDRLRRSQHRHGQQRQRQHRRGDPLQLVFHDLWLLSRENKSKKGIRIMLT